MHKPIIEKNIPIPRKQVKKAKWVLLVDQMDVGDSVLVDNKRERSALNNAMVAKGYKATQRIEGDKLRVWRIS